MAPSSLRSRLSALEQRWTKPIELRLKLLTQSERQIYEQWRTDRPDKYEKFIDELDGSRLPRVIELKLFGVSASIPFSINVRDAADLYQTMREET